MTAMSMFPSVGVSSKVIPRELLSQATSFLLPCILVMVVLVAPPVVGCVCVCLVCLLFVGFEVFL
jgi:hypothetical protein